MILVITAFVMILVLNRPNTVKPCQSKLCLSKLRHQKTVKVFGDSYTALTFPDGRTFYDQPEEVVKRIDDRAAVEMLEAINRAGLCYPDCRPDGELK